MLYTYCSFATEVNFNQNYLNNLNYNTISFIDTVKNNNITVVSIFLLILNVTILQFSQSKQIYVEKKNI